MGRSRMLAAAVLSAWLMATLCVWFSATQSFATVDRMMKDPGQPLTQIAKPLGDEMTRMVLRHTAAEINRSVFWGYGALQIVLGTILFLLVWKQKPRAHVDVGIVATMLVLSLILTVVITPWIVALGRSIDFLPRNPPPEAMPRFWALHGSFTGIDGVKMLAGVGLLFRWIVRAKSSNAPTATV